MALIMPKSIPGKRLAKSPLSTPGLTPGTLDSCHSQMDADGARGPKSAAGRRAGDRLNRATTTLTLTGTFMGKIPSASFLDILNFILARYTDAGRWIL